MNIKSKIKSSASASHCHEWSIWCKISQQLINKYIVDGMRARPIILRVPWLVHKWVIGCWIINKSFSFGMLISNSWILMFKILRWVNFDGKIPFPTHYILLIDRQNRHNCTFSHKFILVQFVFFVLPWKNLLEYSWMYQIKTRKRCKHNLS